jgi:uncharacterized SAM-binding protein YcdF (DUF218 family)
MSKAAVRIFRWLRNLAAALGVLVVVVSFTPLMSWWSARLAGPWTDASGDVLVVLAGSGAEQEMVGESSYWRAFYAALAWRKGGWRKIVVLGGGNPPAAAPIKTFLESAGVPASAILIESESSSTRESALNAKPILANLAGRKVLLTSDYHMFRAWRVFRKAGLDLVPRPVPDAGKRGLAWNLRWGVFEDLSLESVKIVYYSLRGWM